MRFVKICYHQSLESVEPITEEFSTFDLKDSIEKTRQALEIAYAGFDNAVDEALIDSYIYEIYALQKRYEHLLVLASAQPTTPDKKLCVNSPIRALVSHVFS